MTTGILIPEVHENFDSYKCERQVISQQHTKVETAVSARIFLRSEISGWISGEKTDISEQFQGLLVASGGI